MNALLVAPIAAPLAGAGLAVVGRRWRWVQRLLSLTVAVSLTALGGALVAATTEQVHVVAIGGWPARFAIVLVADPLAALLITVTGIIATVVLLAAMAGSTDDHPFFHPLVLALLAGACGSFLTGDLFNLFVWFEVTLIASYVLAVLDGSERQVLSGAVYVSTNLLGSLLVLAGVGLTYAVAGNVNFAVLAERGALGDTLILVPGAVLVTGLAVKAALLPLGGWLAITYPVAPRAVGPLFAGLLTTVGVAALYRVVTIVYGGRSELLATVLIMACLTAVVAAVSAVGRGHAQRMLAFVVMTQAALMLVGLGLGGSLALAAGIFFIVQDVLAKTAIYLAAATADDGSTGASVARPIVAGTFLVAGLSLAGVPPTGGFAGKALILDAVLGSEQWLVAAAVLGASLLTGLAAMRTWQSDIAPGGPQTGSAPARSVSPLRTSVRVAAPTMLVAVVLAAGLVPSPLYRAAQRAAAVLSDPTVYVEAVLP